MKNAIAIILAILYTFLLSGLLLLEPIQSKLRDRDAGHNCNCTNKK